MNEHSTKFFQPRKSLSVDGRMVNSKARSGIRQYIKDKVVKWGYKLWVLADPQTGYTIQFYVYTGKREKASANGLAFDVVTKLCEPYLDQGYHIYMDNFYTSTALPEFAEKVYAGLRHNKEGSPWISATDERQQLGEEG
ncbi:hypothetical protein HPB51_020874 [Rhipicephalus microplus]|uniref:PiggyBac transposable element-derived protein domain-containing protein n=1 Tax=Rhipicephalus microplus TaxID=6941 RepID=A0A9J6E363_RHIMP|nr:hypothetical protein HPB51_020874 [Rhipicephalus microplus]